MRRFPFLLLVLLLALPVTASAQQAIAPDQLAAYTKAYTAIGQLRDRMEAEFADPQNKKPEAIDQLQLKMRTEVAKIVKDNGLTDAQYNNITFAISAEPEQRKAFELLMGIAPLAPPPPAVTMSADANANPHIGHVMTSFSSTTNAEGLLPAAMSEAKVVIDHAALAKRNASSLDAMKLHAGHVIHAVEPVAGVSGPGTGFGLKKAAASVAQHIELAAKAPGATPAVTTHSVHIAASARNTVKRSDEILVIARKIQAATSVSEAASLVDQLVKICGFLLPGADANGDGKIGWEDGEGGLAHVGQHLGLMTK